MTGSNSTADSMPMLKDDGGIEDITKIFTALSPLFGSGKTKEGSSTSSFSDPATMGQSDELLRQIMESISSDNLDVMTGNILERAKQTFAPANIMPNAAGVRGYSDTVNKSLKNEAMARASAEAMSARLNAINAANKTAADLVSAKMQTTKTTQQQGTKQTGPNNAGKLFALATPAAMLYNKFGRPKKTGSSSVNNDPNVTGDGGNVIAGDVNADSSISGGFPVQDFGNDDALFLNANESEVPLSLDFGSDPFIAGDTVTSATEPLSVDPDLSADPSVDPSISVDPDPSVDPGDIGLSTAGDALAEDTSWLDLFNDPDLSFFADGGIVPGTRPAPLGYTGQAISARTNQNQAPRASLAQDSSNNLNSNIQTTTKRKTSTSNQENNILGIPEGSGDAGAPSAVAAAPEGSSPPVGLSTALGVIGGLIGIGGPIGVAAAIGMALANNNVGGQSLSQSLDALISNAPDDASNAISTAVGSNAGETSDAAAASNTATAAESGAPASDAPSSDASGDGGSSSSDGGGDGGGDGFSQGGEIKAKNRQELRGVDKKKIYVTPGEAILPVDTVAALESEFGDNFIERLIAETHTPMRRTA